MEDFGTRWVTWLKRRLKEIQRLTQVSLHTSNAKYSVKPCLWNNFILLFKFNDLIVKYNKSISITNLIGVHVFILFHSSLYTTVKIYFSINNYPLYVQYMYLFSILIRLYTQVLLYFDVLIYHFSISYIHDMVYYTTQNEDLCDSKYFISIIYIPYHSYIQNTLP